MTPGLHSLFKDLPAIQAHHYLHRLFSPTLSKSNIVSSLDLLLAVIIATAIRVPEPERLFICEKRRNETH